MADAPDLWGEDPPSWDETRAYYPGTGDPPASHSTSPTTPMPPGLDWVNIPNGDSVQQPHAPLERPQPAQPRHAAEAAWPPRSEPFGSTGENRRVPAVDPERFRGDPRWRTPQPASDRDGPTPTPGAPRASQSRLDNLVRPVRRQPATGARPGQHGVRHSTGPTDRPERSAADATYGLVLGLVAIWYLAPLLVTTVWLLFLDADRRTLAYRELLTNLPWAFGAFVMSMGVAALLRLAAISWRTWTLAFAAAVIGAGLATVLHSFTV
jgi:hypothetical protein